MRKIALTNKQSLLFADKTLDLANFSLSSAVIGQFLTGSELKVTLVLIGAVLYTILNLLAYLLTDKKGNK